MNEEAIGRAMQRAYLERTSIIHVHEHSHVGLIMQLVTPWHASHNASTYLEYDGNSHTLARSPLEKLLQNRRCLTSKGTRLVTRCFMTGYSYTAQRPVYQLRKLGPPSAGSAKGNNLARLLKRRFSRFTRHVLEDCNHVSERAQKIERGTEQHGALMGVAGASPSRRLSKTTSPNVLARARESM